jgi:hypothetical protein
MATIINEAGRVRRIEVAVEALTRYRGAAHCVTFAKLPELWRKS